jgi:hypothetical protein
MWWKGRSSEIQRQINVMEEDKFASSVCEELSLDGNKLSQKSSKITRNLK